MSINITKILIISIYDNLLKFIKVINNLKIAILHKIANCPTLLIFRQLKNFLNFRLFNVKRSKSDNQIFQSIPQQIPTTLVGNNNLPSYYYNRFILFVVSGKEKNCYNVCITLFKSVYCTSLFKILVLNSNASQTILQAVKGYKKGKVFNLPLLIILLCTSLIQCKTCL